MEVLDKTNWLHRNGDSCGLLVLRLKIQPPVLPAYLLYLSSYIIKMCIDSTNADIVVLSKSWLKQSVHDKGIYINGYNVFQTNGLKKSVSGVVI